MSAAVACGLLLAGVKPAPAQAAGTPTPAAMVLARMVLTDAQTQTPGPDQMRSLARGMLLPNSYSRGYDPCHPANATCAAAAEVETAAIATDMARAIGKQRTLELAGQLQRSLTLAQLPTATRFPSTADSLAVLRSLLDTSWLVTAERQVRNTLDQAVKAGRSRFLAATRNLPRRNVPIPPAPLGPPLEVDDR